MTTLALLLQFGYDLSLGANFSELGLEPPRLEDMGLQRDHSSVQDEAAGHNPERWLDEYGDALYRFALARVHDRNKAQDAVQETLLAALKSRGTFTGQSSVRTWLFGILKHKIVDMIRAEARFVAVDNSDKLSATLDDLFNAHGHYRVPPRNWRVDPEKAFERSEFWDCFQSCLAALPPRSARVFALRELDGLAGEEICKILNISSTNYWVMLHRARLALRECLERKWFIPGEGKDT